MPRYKRTTSKKRIVKKRPLPSKSDHIRLIIGIILVCFGLFFISHIPNIFIDAFANEPIIADESFDKAQEESKINIISISTLGIELDVKPSKLINGYWEVSESTASHGLGSANPGDGGNVVIFAHAREGMFGNLRSIKKDDVIDITTSDKKYSYKVNEIITVEPNDVKVVAPTNSEVLTLFTCSGFFDEKRLIVKALPIK